MHHIMNGGFRMTCMYICVYIYTYTHGIWRWVMPKMNDGMNIQLCKILWYWGSLESFDSQPNKKQAVNQQQWSLLKQQNSKIQASNWGMDHQKCRTIRDGPEEHLHWNARTDS